MESRVRERVKGTATAKQPEMGMEKVRRWVKVVRGEGRETWTQGERAWQG